MLDLYHARREDLIRLILAQCEALAEQAAVLARQTSPLRRSGRVLRALDACPDGGQPLCGGRLKRGTTPAVPIRGSWPPSRSST